jgi:chitodextrinase
VYGANRDRQVFEINLTTGAVVQSGTLLVGTQAIEQDPETGYVYYFERGSSGDDFAYWNPATGANLRVRRYVPRPGFFAKRLAFAPDGTLYLMDDTDVLWTIDKQTGNLTRLGFVSGLVTGSRQGTGDIAFGPDSTMYLNTYRNVYTVDRASLTATPLFLNVLGTGQIGTGLAYCNDALFASLEDIPAQQTRVVRIDLFTGAVLPVAAGLWVLNDLTSCPAGEPPPPPVAPSLLTAQALPSGGIQLQWQDNSIDELGFRIERRTGSQAFQLVATTAASVSSYTDTGLAPQTTYTYRVRAFNGGGNSSYSEEASATTLGNSPPTAEILAPANGAVYAVGATIVYSGNAVDPEDGTLPNSAFVWQASRVGGSFQPLASGVRSGSLVATAAGDYVIRLTVTDSGGLTNRVEVNLSVR